MTKRALYILSLLSVLLLYSCSRLNYDKCLDYMKKKDNEQVRFNIASFNSWLFEPTIHNKYSPLRLSSVMRAQFPFMEDDIIDYYSKINPLDINLFIESLPLKKIASICYNDIGELYYFPSIRSQKFETPIIHGFHTFENPWTPCHFVSTEGLDLSIIMTNIFVLYQLWVTDHIDIVKYNGNNTIIWRNNRIRHLKVGDTHKTVDNLKLDQYFKILSLIQPNIQNRKLNIGNVKEVQHNYYNYYTIYKNNYYTQLNNSFLSIDTLSINHPNAFLYSRFYRSKDVNLRAEIKHILNENLNKIDVIREKDIYEVYLTGAKQYFGGMYNDPEYNKSKSLVLYEYLIAPKRFLLKINKLSHYNKPELIYKKINSKPKNLPLNM